MSACNKDDDEPSSIQTATDLLSHFASEASDHGWNVNLDLIVWDLKDSVGRNGQTFCGYASTVDGKRLIEIDTTSNCWTSGKYAREIIIFHTLGHALLNRGHRDTKMPNGDWRTTMNSGTLLDLYHRPQTKFKRSYYIDELFDENTPIPEWAK